MDILDLIEHIISALKEIGDNFLQHPSAYILLLSLWTICVVTISKKWLKHKEDEIDSREKILKNKEKEYNTILKENEQLKEKNDELNKKLSSEEYSAFLVSKGLVPTLKEDNQW